MRFLEQLENGFRAEQQPSFYHARDLMLLFRFEFYYDAIYIESTKHETKFGIIPIFVGPFMMIIIYRPLNSQNLPMVFEGTSALSLIRHFLPETLMGVSLT
jgi:hypothetical protein